MPITVNLESALRHLRHIGIYQIWADALCINQKDVEERTLQVRLMKRIYQRADTVIVWLGPNMGNILKRIGLETQLGRYRTTGTLEQLASREEKLEFLNLPYWKRAWVVQEIAVARELMLLSGSVQLTWYTFNETLLSSSDVFPGSGAYADKENIRSHPKRLIDFKNKRKTGVVPDLIDAMKQHQGVLVTDPRDKIISLLGVCSDGDDLMPFPNYTQPIEIILRDFTRAVLSARQNLAILFHRTAWPDAPTTMLSWVQD